MGTHLWDDCWMWAPLWLPTIVPVEESAASYAVFFFKVNPGWAAQIHFRLSSAPKDYQRTTTYEIRIRFLPRKTNMNLFRMSPHHVTLHIPISIGIIIMHADMKCHPSTTTLTQPQQSSTNQNMIICCWRIPDTTPISFVLKEFKRQDSDL